MKTPDFDMTPAHARSALDEAWNVTLAAARTAPGIVTARDPITFGADSEGDLYQVPAGGPGALLRWEPSAGWMSLLSSEDSRHALLDLYLPFCSATPGRPMTVGHLGQSLDGFIAMPTGESQNVTGEENILHLHRMRALCDAIVVGAGTVAADDPQLTTRHVLGPNPLRVVLDPGRRLGEQYRLFTDTSAETLCICARSLVRSGESRVGRAALLGIDMAGEGLDVAEVLAYLHARGCFRVFVEGGGVTVSTFLEAGLLDRLQVAIAPLIIGDGRPAIRLPARTALRDCHRPDYRVFRMGSDILFDCDLSGSASSTGTATDESPPLSRVI